MEILKNIIYSFILILSFILFIAVLVSGNIYILVIAILLFLYSSKKLPREWVKFISRTMLILFILMLLFATFTAQIC